MPLPRHLRALLLVLFVLPLARAQDDITIKLSGDAANRTRIAVADFKPAPATPEPLRQTFDTVLYSDLANAGIFDLVSKSIAPHTIPGTPAEISLTQWSAAPA